jgi:L-threonylcarbamoyladenylate synthase
VTADDVAEFERCIAAGGVALFPADTVYGLATDPESREGVERLYAIKGRRPEVPAAVMFFSLEQLPELDARSREIAERLLPGAVTLVVPNPERRYPLAGGGDRLGIRVPLLEGELAPLAAMGRPVLQSSANPSGGADARRVEDVDQGIREGVDLVLDGEELPGTSSTVVDLTGVGWRVLREGAVPRAELSEVLD